MKTKSGKSVYPYGPGNKHGNTKYEKGDCRNHGETWGFFEYVRATYKNIFKKGARA